MLEAAVPDGPYGRLIQPLQGAFALGMPCTTAGAASGCVTKLQIAYTMNKDLMLPDLTICAASSGSVQVLAWLQQLRACFNAETSACAAKAGHTHVLRYLHQQRSLVGISRVAGIAAVRGDAKIFRFLHQTRPNCYTSRIGQAVLVQAAGSGSVELMEWLVEHGVQLDASAMPPAVYCGHLDMCKYLYSQGCGWSAELTAAAIDHNRVDIVSWVVAAGLAELTAEQQSRLVELKRA
jgi:hypothetical protein